MSMLACSLDAPVESISSRSTGSTTFTGTVTGTAYVPLMPPDQPSAVDLAIVNIKVELRTSDDILVTTVATTEGGAFSIPFTYEATTDQLDLFLRFVAESGDGMIRVRKKAVFKETRTQDIHDDKLSVAAGSPSLVTDLGAVALDPSELKPQLLHWANRSRQFVAAGLGNSSPLPNDPATPLDILTPPFGWPAATFFVPGSSYDELVEVAALFLGGVVAIEYINHEFSDQDGLYISEDDEQDDDTTMHEFGHYVMWHAQGKKWLNPFTASFAKHATFTNADNSKIAWTEGFAGGFSRMVDAWSYADDREGADDAADEGPVTAGGYDSSLCGTAGYPACNVQATTHGFFSELYIDHALYDLWDGPTALVSGPGGGHAPVYSSYYEDLAGSTPTDPVELSFADIMQPILATRTGTQSSLVTSIVDYHWRLQALKHDRAIKDVFVAHHIKNLHPAQTAPELQDLPNTDMISFERDLEVERYAYDETGLTGVRDPVTERFTVDVPGLYTAQDDYNLASIMANAALTLSDDLVVDGSAGSGNATLTFNSKTRPIGWRLTGNTYAAPAGVTTTSSATLAVTVAAGARLSARNRGTLVLGQPANGQRATVTIAAGATLALGGGPGGRYPELDPVTGELVSKGKLVINPGSKLIIERGATLAIDRGAEITLDGPGAELIIRGKLDIHDNATLWWTATNGGMVTFDLENKGGDPNVDAHQGSEILVDEVAFTIADNTYLRMPEGVSTRLTLQDGALGRFGRGAYIDGSHATVTLKDSTIEASGSWPHAGVILNGASHTIEGMTFSGGDYCLRETQPGVRLRVTTSEFTACKTAIDVTTDDLLLLGVTITGGTTGIETRGSIGVSIVNSQITGARVGWHLVNRGNGNQGVTSSLIGGAAEAGVLVEGPNPIGAPPVAISGSTIDASTIGIRSVGNLVRIEGGSVEGNTIGVRMELGAVLDLGSAAGAEFRGNPTSIRLDRAGKPRLGGGNRFFPQNTAISGMAITGTISDTAACTTAHTISAATDLWEVWDAFQNAYVGGALSAQPARYDITSTGNSCRYTLL